MGRTVKPNGELIRELRKSKGWTTLHLAELADCSKRTIENIEAGKEVYPFTLSLIAKQLGKPVEALVEGALPEKAADKRISVSISLSIPFEEFDQSEQLTTFMTLLNRLINSDRNEDKSPRVISVSPGSSWINLEMDKESLLRLVVIMPGFREYAREVVGRHPDAGELLAMADAIIEMRIPVERAEPTRGVAENPSYQPQEPTPEINTVQSFGIPEPEAPEPLPEYIEKESDPEFRSLLLEISRGMELWPIDSYISRLKQLPSPERERRIELMKIAHEEWWLRFESRSEESGRNTRAVDDTPPQS